MKAGKYAFISFVAILFLSSACQTVEKKKETKREIFKAAVPEGVYLFEAESFRLVETTIITDDEASGGEAVRLLSNRAFCSIDISLSPGTYVARARARAVDEDHDGFFLSVGKAVVKMSPAVFKRYSYCPQVLEFTINAPGKDYLQFAAFSVLAPKGETGAVVDLLEIWEKSKWEEEGNKLRVNAVHSIPLFLCVSVPLWLSLLLRPFPGNEKD